MGIWNQTFDDLRKPYLEGKDQEKKSKRWQDDDGDGKWYEKSDVDGKISDREKKEKKKNSKKNEAYTVTNADKKGNTKAYQGFVAGMKSKVTGKPMYKAADHMKTEHHSKDCNDTCEPNCEHDQEVTEASLETARKNIGKDPKKASCWDGYKASGTKMKGGKSVPDCKKEDVEVVNELSKNTLGGYVKKASKETRMNVVSTQHGSGIPKKARDIKQRQISKRLKGMEKAGEKLAKENAELIDERGRDDSTTLGDNALSKAKRLGQKRRNSKEYKSGLRRGTGAKEYDNYKLARKQHSNDASSENQMSRSKPQRGEGNKAKRRAGQKVRNTRNDRVVSTRDGFKVVRGEHLDWRSDLGYITEKSECDSGDKKAKKQKRESTSS